MAERQIEHWKSCLVFSVCFPVVNWRSPPVAKSAYYLSQKDKTKSDGQEMRSKRNFWTPGPWRPLVQDAVLLAKVRIAYGNKINDNLV